MIQIIEATGSTNADLKTLISDGVSSSEGVLREGQWLVANRQTAGKGRLGRAWNDGAGNFMGSTVVRIAHGDPYPASLALLSGVALYQAIDSVLPTELMARSAPALKWPNDLLWDGAKIAGILLEMVGSVVIVGIGVNLITAPHVDGRKIGALTDFGVDVSRDQFAEALAHSFELELTRWRTAGLAPLLRRWQSMAHPKGTPLTVLPPGEDAVNGTFAGLTDDGNLRLSLADGFCRTIHAGDVFLANN